MIVFKFRANEAQDPMRPAYVGVSEDDARAVYDACAHAFLNCQEGDFDEDLRLRGGSRLCGPFISSLNLNGRGQPGGT